MAFLFTLVILATGCSSPSGPPPSEVFLDIEYHALGWSPDLSTWYFLKVLTERRRYAWEYLDAGGQGWVSRPTGTRHVVGAVGADGSGRREVYALEGVPSIRHWTQAAVTSDERVLVASERRVYQLSSEGVTELASLAWKADFFDYIPDTSTGTGRAVVAGNHTGLHLMELPSATIRRLTDGPDRHPRFSPDGRQILFLRWQPDSDVDFRIYDLETETERSLLRKPLNRGLFHQGVEWRDESSVWLGNDYVSAPWSAGELEVAPLPSLGCASEADRRLVSAGGCDGETGSYGHFGRLGRPWVYGVSNVGGTAKILSLHDFEPVIFHEGLCPTCIETPSSCRVEQLFCLERRTISVSSNDRWDEELAAHRDEDGGLW